MSQQELRKAMAQALWLDYFNQTLFAKGVISESQHNQLRRRILARHPAPPLERDPHHPPFVSRQ